jgi:NAD(P)-dependent dehydrogenase (short-subunit alcohol dehydrogenase family)
MRKYLEGLFSLRGQVALVTGASRGIGYFLTNALACVGAEVVGVGRSQEVDDPATCQFAYRRCDIRDQEAIHAVFNETYERFGRFDILVNAAGVTFPLEPESDRLEVFRQTLEANLTSAYWCCEIASGLMKRSGGGSIINVTSIASAQGFPGNPAYVASKGALRSLTKALALDWAPHGIRVNNLAPGYIHTAMTQKSFDDPVKHQDRLERMMIRRWGEAEDLAGAVIYLASDASKYVTGTDLFVDGGWTAKGL